MSIADRLREIRGYASPRKINEVIHSTETDANLVFDALPDEVKARLETRSGEVKFDRKKRFLKNLQSLVEGGFSLSHLIQMDEECVDNKGRVNEKRLRDIIAGKHDD